MIHDFDTDDLTLAQAALVVYTVYRHRNKKRFKIHLGMWGQIERFVKASAKRATTLPLFLESFKVKMSCETLKEASFLVPLYAEGPKIVDALYKQTSWVVLLVRERLSREKKEEDREGQEEKR